jgi:hypothetical protein
MGAIKAIRNVLGAASMVLAGYVIVMSLKDSIRYIKISSM